MKFSWKTGRFGKGIVYEQRYQAYLKAESELAELRKFVADSRLVTLVGAGGCGKTRLARRLAAELSDASDDGVWQVEGLPGAWSLGAWRPGFEVAVKRVG